MPIGSNASYVPAGIKDWTTWGVFEEENYIFNNPNAPMTVVRWSSDLWTGGSRCNPDNASSSPQVTVPLPASFVLPGASNGNTPNNAAAMITQDGNSYVQTQPLTHCTANGPWTTGYVEPTVSIYGDGITGAQGGSHLSSIGGTIRVGEWQTAEQEGRFRHALKTVLDSSNYSDASGPGCNAPGCRWPANSSDCGDTACGYTGNNAQVMMGTLLALPPSYNCAGMRTEPGQIVCETLKDYGMYVVDSGWDPAYLPAEHGPNGNASDDFAAAFGYDMFPTSATTPWALDWRQLVTATQVVANNSASSIGGGGTPRVPLAPPIGN
jgi:hypothetical protein